MRHITPPVALVLSFVLVGAAFLGPGAGRARACSCAGLPGLAEELRAADAVFAGEVANVEADPSSAVGGVRSPGSVTLDVEAAWKGVSENRVVLEGQGDGVSCSYVFEEDERYLVYAGRFEEGESLEASICSATKPLARAEEDLAALGPPPVTLAEVELVTTGGPPIVTGTAVALSTLALLGASVLLRTRRT